MVRYYDVYTDTFITDRKAILDHLVKSAAEILTFSERRAKPKQPSGHFPSKEATALLHRAEGAGHPIERAVFRPLVAALWRSWVTEAPC